MAITGLTGRWALGPQGGYKRRKRVELENSNSTPDTAWAADTGAAQKSAGAGNPCKSATACAAAGES
jgi:hypothetical protein